jgi:hypothetical protein
MKKILFIALFSCQCQSEDLIYSSGFENEPSLSGMAFGLSSMGLQLSLQAGEISETLNIDSDGSFSFNQTVPNGASWSVQIQSQPYDPQPQLCTLKNNSGVMTLEGVTDIQVYCSDEESSNWDEMNWDQGQWK